MQILNYAMWGNSIQSYLVALLVFAGGVVFLKIFKSIVIARIKELSAKTKTELDDMTIDAINSIHWPFFVLASFYVSLNFIMIPESIRKWFFYAFLISAVYYSIKFINELINFTVKKLSKKQENQSDAAIIKLLGTVAKITLWIGAGLLVLSNMGVNVSSLIAGMGIGGIAVALALQNVLGDLFSSLSIYFDKPFRIGDYITIGTQSGHVKKVGLKTTRIETPQGEELVVANSELTKAQLSNFGAMKRRRVVFSVGVTYDTPLSKLKKIPDWIKEIINSHGEMTEIVRIHFATFGDFSLIYNIVYYVNSKEYNDYMDIQENINFKILEKFEEENVEMAFPTQTLYLKKDS